MAYDIQGLIPIESCLANTASRKDRKPILFTRRIQLRVLPPGRIDADARAGVQTVSQGRLRTEPLTT